MTAPVDLPARVQPARVDARPRRAAGRPLARALWLLPFLGFAVVFGAYPLLQVVRMAVSSVELSGGRFVWSFNGGANFPAVLGDGASWNALTNTLVFVIAAVAGTLVVGTVLALLVDRAVTTLPLARNLLIWPAVIAPVVVSLMWLLLLSPTAGGLNKFLATVGLPTQNWLDSGTGAMAAVIVVDVWHWSPVVFLFVYTALRAIDPALLEAARIDGARESQLLGRIVLPLLAPAIGAVTLVRIIMSVKAFDEMYLLTAGGPNGATTLVSQHIRDLFFVSLRFGEASAYGIVVVLLTAVVAGVALFARSRSGLTR